MWAARAALLVSTFLWTALAVMGADLLHFSVEQSVSGYPNAPQRNYYLHIPVLMAGGSLLLLVGSWLHKTTRLFGWFAGLLLLCLPLYLLFYTGGM